ncbi:MAG TPA: hypothetical protein PKY59_19715 [Pyrinomonadaceae bacterium]|nr:hypothetical protein [Pyrinomonadaceae bacterium]
MKLLLFFPSFVFLLLFTSEIFACTCMHQGSFEKPTREIIDLQLKGAGAIFSGEVVRIVSVKESKNSLYSTLKVHLKVSSAWKGVKTENVVVSTSSASNFCGFPFKVGQKYLVYADKYKTELFTSLCKRTVSLDSAAKDIEYLGEAEKVFAETKKKKLIKKKKQ